MIVAMNREDDPSLMTACCMFPPPPHMDQSGGAITCAGTGGTVYYCPSNQSGCCPQHPPPPTNPAVLHHHHHIDYFVYHDYPSNCPMTVPMVPTVRPSPPPMPMPVQVPVGHMVQQIVDETGQLRHVILSPQHVAGSPGPPPRVDPNQPPQPPAEFFPGYYAPLIPPPHGPPPPMLHPNPAMLRDERSNRQYQKLKRRLEHKQQSQPAPVPLNHASTSSSSPPASPNRKPPSGGSRRSKDRSMSSRPGRESSSSPQPPSDQSAPLSPAPPVVLSVSEIQQTTALLTWAPPDASAASMSGSEDSGVAGSEISGAATPQPCDSLSAMYKVMVGKKGPDGSHKIVYFGPEYSHLLDNLQPGTEYSVKLSVRVGESGGLSNTASVTFVTLAGPPAPPPAPKLASRTKTTLSIKWNSTTNHGMPVTHYNVELGENGEEIVWRQVYSGKDKQCTVSKLNAGQQYFFRVSATNQLGTSDFSPEAAFLTASPPPAAPSAPQLAPMPPPSPYTLSVCWAQHPNTPVTYTLEMTSVRMDDTSLTTEDLAKRNVGGFMPVYHGDECHYLCTNLMPATTYLFRLRVNTVDGLSSAWSPPVQMGTPPTVPTAPPKPQTRGRIHSQSMKLRWEPPSNFGGVNLLGYVLQIDDGTGFCDVWSGTGQEALVSGLEPGHTYALRVCARNIAGLGPFSEPLRTNTAPAPPCAPTWSRKQVQPTSHTISLHWEPPVINGGAAVTHYEVELSFGEDRGPVYRGADAKCDISSGLSPATKYTLFVRACNTAGAGPWSSPIEMETAVAPPCSPCPPAVVVTKSGCASFTWEPLAMAVTYCLELALVVPAAPPLPPNPPLPPSPTSEAPPNVPEEPPTPNYEVVYSGGDTKCEVKRLLPGASYLARLQGSNCSGTGPFSEAVTFTTPLSPPGAPPHAPRIIKTENDGEFAITTVHFEPPSHWGGDKSDALSYLVEITVAGEHMGSPQVVVCQEPHLEDCALALDTSYRIRVRAVNSVGPGPLSSALRFTTPPPPPPAPRLQLAAAMPRALRLNWEPAEDQLAVCVEVRRGEAQEFQIVYEGADLGCKVSRLREDCEYQFRARATGKGGEGQPGPIQTFRTLPAPKPIPRGLRVCDITSGSCLVMWQALKAQHSHPAASDTEMHCYVQVSTQRNVDYKKVYRGSELKCSVNKLTPSTEYWLRAAFVPYDALDPEEGPFCAPINFTTSVFEPPPPTPTPVDVIDSSKEVSSSTPLQFSMPKVWPLIRRWRRTSVKDLSDRQKVFLFVLVFVVSAVVLAMLISRFM